MDQTNPLAELTHKRRLSALGPGGLTRERAGFEVRDVHYSQYGRMCPIETPEGPNIGLITSLSCYARVNDLGFIETPYRVVKNGKVTDEIAWLDANEEEDAIDRAGERARSNPTATSSTIWCSAVSRATCRSLPPDRIDYMDVAPEQLVSIAAALIPFLEHDDANRALMGSNMQRQSVPLLNPAARRSSARGSRRRWPRDSGAVVIAQRGGVGHARDGRRDHRRRRSGRERTKQARGRPSARAPHAARPLPAQEVLAHQPGHRDQPASAGALRARRSRRATCWPTAPAPSSASSPSASNVTVAFMPWYGHNFEDAIVLSERLVKDDVYSSIHIQELELHVRDTKRGQEEITREIPNVSEESLVDLDERGIVRIGAHVKPGDILVGKITPKGETELSPEEKLLTAIFGEKAKDVKDSSLKVPPGMEGVVIDVQDLLAHRGPGGREGPRRADRRSAPPRGRGEGPRQRSARRRADRDCSTARSSALVLKSRHGRRGHSGRAPS